MKSRIRKYASWLAALFVTILVMTTIIGCSDGETRQSRESGSAAQAAETQIPETQAAVSGESTAARETVRAPQKPESTEAAADAEVRADADSGTTGAEVRADADSDTAGAGVQADKNGDTAGAEIRVDEDGVYTSKEEVALYLHTYGKLPSNYITKDEAEELGWKQKQGKAGQLQNVAPGKSIGGDRFGNYEGQLPEKKGRRYFECDIDYVSGNRGAKRIIYSNDGLIFYTGDHYQTFEQLYPQDSGE